MKIQAVSNDDPSVNISGAAQERQTEQTGAKVRRQGNVKSIFAGDLGIGIQNDPVSQKKKQAQNQALKIIGEAWDVDRRFDQSVAGGTRISMRSRSATSGKKICGRGTV